MPTRSNEGPAILREMLTFGTFGRTKTKRRKSTLPRDSQMSKVYRAEEMAFPDAHPGKGSTKRPRDWFASTVEAEIFVNRILRSDRAHKAVRKAAEAFAKQTEDGWKVSEFYRWPGRVAVETGPDGMGGSAGNGRIKVSPGFRNKVVLIHELAHLVAPVAEKHGRLFAAIELALVRSVLGTRDHDALRKAFKAKGVKYTAKRTLSPERKAALVKRLAEYRSKQPKSLGEAFAQVVATNAAADHRHREPGRSIALALANSDTSYR